MTWGECRLECLRKMFASEGGTVNETDESVQDYLYAMPQAANEGVSLICAARPVRKGAVLEGGQMIDLDAHLPDFLQAGTPEAYTADGLEPVDIRLVAGRYLYAPKGSVLYFYDARPSKITQDTASDAELGLEEDAAVLLPLYMASQLYKEDDLSIATAYRNEFESALERLTVRAGGEVRGEFMSKTGWW